MITQIVVLAGGLATRLYPITTTIPKSMVPVAGEPFLTHQLRSFKKNGITNVVMCVGHFADQIIDHFGDGKQFGLSIKYSVEKEKLDTGGALKNAYPYLDDVFFTIYGDSFLRQPYAPVAEFFFSNPSEGLMCVYENNNQIEPSRVLLDDTMVKQYKKDPPPEGAQHMEYGLNILKKNLIPQVEKLSFPISDYFDILAPQQQLLAFPVQERFYEIGSKEGLAETDALLRSLSIRPS